MNLTLKQLHDLLLARHNALSDQLGHEADPAKAEAILTEMQELLHRIDLVQGLLFRQSSQKLDDCLARIKKADDALGQATQSIKNAADLVKSMSEFLKAVDEAIDLAKTLAVT
ncbi:MAG TPA: hypothetical protein VL171_07500 [Verrucomicrobiae bacterium]|nr:hypothetical protein [Verrucomicrobiae bacterium]